jgi:streptomycin 6-kinase
VPVVCGHACPRIDNGRMLLHVPHHLTATCRQKAEWTTWLDRLPATVESLLKRWSLTLGTVYDESASCAWVASATCADDTPAVLKLGLPHMEGRDEAHGLRFWDGDPTARLLMSDDELGAMLLELCEPGTSLRLQPEPEQNQVIATLLHRLWRTPKAPHPFRPLSALMEYWSAETLDRAEEWPDAELIRDGLRLFAELPRTARREVLLATDLHAANVLRAQRQPWLVIDPKPFIGDPAYDLTQHLFNCSASLCADPWGTIRRFADLVGIDEERVRLWTFARAAAEPRADWKNSSLIPIARALSK